uniref:Uncharacterized protein n=1 Tax=Romanomermis culicivorax TaxID=13658 RepID=A0A915JCW8_ROMCU
MAGAMPTVTTAPHITRGRTNMTIATITTTTLSAIARITMAKTAMTAMMTINCTNILRQTPTTAVAIDFAILNTCQQQGAQHSSGIETDLQECAAATPAQSTKRSLKRIHRAVIEQKEIFRRLAPGKFSASYMWITVLRREIPRCAGCPIHTGASWERAKSESKEAAPRGEKLSTHSTYDEISTVKNVNSARYRLDRVDKREKSPRNSFKNIFFRRKNFDLFLNDPLLKRHEMLHMANQYKLIDSVKVKNKKKLEFQLPVKGSSYFNPIFDCEYISNNDVKTPQGNSVENWFAATIQLLFEENSIAFGPMIS